MYRLTFLVIAAAGSAAAQDIYAPQPPSPDQFAIMAWGGSPSDLAQLRRMKEAGLNISGFCRTQDVDAVGQAGLACFVSDERVNGYDWKKLPPETEIRKNIEELARLVRGKPAAIGFYLIDEPHASLMPPMGKVAAILREAMPGTWPYVNLFPYRVSAERMGTPTYDIYVRMLVDVIGQPFLSYDNYSLVGGEMLDSFFNNLEVVRRHSLETKAPIWNCILANAHFNYMEPSDASFHLQVYSTMAYGGRGIQYFTYFTPQIGNYRLGAIDWFGNKTPTWDMLRRINRQIHALAPTLAKLRSTGVYHYPSPPEYGRPLAESKLVKSVEMTQRLVRSPAAGRFLIGELEDSQGRPYFMIVNKDLNNSFRFAVELKQEGRKLIRISSYSGQEEEFGREMDWLAPGAGILFRVE
jgi:hypothetical protein